MKDDSPQQPAPGGPDPGQEKWITKAEVLKLFNIEEHNLKYWCSINKIRAYKVSRRKYYYNENDVRAMVEKQASAKKRARKQFVAKKLGNIDVGVLMVILALGLLLAYFSPPWGNKTFTRFEVMLPFYWIFFFAFVYWFVRFLQYIYKRFFRKEIKK
jgi:hypothetical protein